MNGKCTLRHIFSWVCAVAAGLLFRLSATLFAIGLIYVQLIDVSTYLNHYYLAALLAVLLAASPAGRFWSFDAWVRSRWRAVPLPAASVSTLWLYLFRFQVGVVYFFAGMAKLQPDWLLHAQRLEYLLVVPGCRLPGELRHSALGSLDAIVDRLVHKSDGCCLEEVLSQLAKIGRQIDRVELLDRIADLSMQTDAPSR